MRLRRMALAVLLASVVALPGSVVIGLVCEALGWGSTPSILLGAIWGSLCVNVAIAKIVYGRPIVRVTPTVTYTGSSPRTWRFPEEWKRP